MDLFNRILKLRRNVNPSEFSLQDDGNGPFISRWDSSEAKPTDAEIANVDDSKPTWVVAQEEIEKLESTITPRRLTEAVLTEDGKTWLTDVKNKIETERAKL